MGSTLVSFEWVRRAAFAYGERWLSQSGAFSWGEFSFEGIMITFDSVVQIEAIRREIECLQERLANQGRAQYFAVRDQVGGTGQWDPLPEAIYSGPLRETLCKVTALKIVQALDRAAKLGVDTQASREAVLSFLETLKPPASEASSP